MRIGDASQGCLRDKLTGFIMSSHLFTEHIERFFVFFNAPDHVAGDLDMCNEFIDCRADAVKIFNAVIDFTDECRIDVCDHALYGFQFGRVDTAHAFIEVAVFSNRVLQFFANQTVHFFRVFNVGQTGFDVQYI